MLASCARVAAREVGKRVATCWVRAWGVPPRSASELLMNKVRSECALRKSLDADLKKLLAGKLV